MSFLMLNLEKYYNNKAIAINGKQESGFSFIDLQQGKKLIIGDIPFFMSREPENNCDNIACELQTIYFEQADYTKIHILGFANEGDFRDQLALEFANGNTNYIDLQFLHWVGRKKNSEYKEFNFEREVMYPNCELAVEVKNQTQTGALTYYWHDIDFEAKNLIGIQLPDNILLHIFAITLEK